MREDLPASFSGKNRHKEYLGVGEHNLEGLPFGDAVDENDFSDLESLEEELYEIEHVPKSDLATTAEAKEIILKYFREYTPSQLDADKPHHILASLLEQHFWGYDWNGEITGSLEPAVIDLLLPILDEVEDKFPNYGGAISRFKKLYCSPAPEPWSPQLAERLASAPPDPYRYIREEDQQEVIEQYASPDCEPEEAVGFALRAMHSGTNNFVGTELVSRLVSQYGWESFLSTAGAVHLAGNERGSLYGSLVEVVYKLSAPHDLPDEKVEQLYEFAQNDLEWVSLNTYLHQRKKAISLSGITPEEGRRILREAKQYFFDVDRVKYLSKYMLEHNAGARRALMEIFRESLGVNEIEKRSLQRYQDLSSELLSEEIPPSILYDFIAQYQFDISTYPPEDQILVNGNLVAASCLLSDSKTIDKLQSVLQQDSVVFRESLELIVRNESFNSRAVVCGGGYDIVAHHALREIDHDDYDQESLDYMRNCSATFLSQETMATFDPAGRFLGLYKVPNHKGLGRLDMDLSNYSAMLAQFDEPYSLQENVARIITDLWYCIPEDMKEVITERVTESGRRIEDFLYQSQEDRINFVKHTVFLANVVGNTPGLIESVREMILKKLAETYKKLEYPDTIDDNELLILMNTEYGESNLTEREVRDTIRSLSFSAMRHLQETFKIDFGKLKRREFFGLLQYLKQSKNGEGFANLKELAESAGDDSEATLHRIRAFMSLETHPDAGDAIISIAKAGREQPEVSREIFEAYNEILEDADSVEENLCRLYGCGELDNNRLIRSIARRLLERGAELLKECAKELQAKGGTDLSLATESVLRKLRQVDADTVFLNESFPEMKKENPGLQLEQLASVDLRTVSNEQVRNNQALLQQMRDIYITNWEGDESGRNGAEMMSELEERLEGEGRVYVATLVGEDGPVLLSFASVVDEAGGSSYASGLNRNPELEVGNIGTIMIRRILKEEATDKRLTAKAKHGSSTARAYINQYGSLGVGLIKKQEKVSLQIAFDSELREQAVSTHWKNRKEAEELAPQYEGRVILCERPDLAKEEALYEAGYVLTRFFSGGLVVFEKVNVHADKLVSLSEAV